jgi:hypothetical protein
MLTSAIVASKRAFFFASCLLEEGQQIELFNQATLLLESTRHRQVIDRTVAIDEIEVAHCYVEGGRKVGNLGLLL